MLPVVTSGNLLQTSCLCSQSSRTLAGDSCYLPDLHSAGGRAVTVHLPRDPRLPGHWLSVAWLVAAPVVSLAGASPSSALPLLPAPAAGEGFPPNVLSGVIGHHSLLCGSGLIRPFLDFQSLEEL